MRPTHSGDGRSVRGTGGGELSFGERFGGNGQLQEAIPHIFVLCGAAFQKLVLKSGTERTRAGDWLGTEPLFSQSDPQRTSSLRSVPAPCRPVPLLRAKHSGSTESAIQGARLSGV